MSIASRLDMEFASMQLTISELRAENERLRKLLYRHNGFWMMEPHRDNYLKSELWKDTREILSE